jgi:hypothetical protein
MTSSGIEPPTFRLVAIFVQSISNSEHLSMLRRSVVKQREKNCYLVGGGGKQIFGGIDNFWSRLELKKNMGV